MILGNGLSRKLFAQQIADWQGEVWACNYAYTEPFASKLTRLTGHANVLREALAHRDANDLMFKVYIGHLGMPKIPGCEPFTCPREYWKDSGTTFVAQALHEGFDVEACGFDLGGADCLSPRLWEQNKRTWVSRWRSIGERWGWDRIVFWGHDHKPFLRSSIKASAYSRRYMEGVPHIPGEEYARLFAEQYGALRGKYVPIQEDRVVTFKFKSGETTQYKESIAEIFAARGLGEIVAAEPAAEAEYQSEDERDFVKDVAARVGIDPDKLQTAAKQAQQARFKL